MTDLVIRPLTDEAVDTLSRLAHEIWHAHYPGIISHEQIDAMLAERYGSSAIIGTLHSQHWDTAWLGEPASENMVGFAHSFTDSEPAAWKLDKLYVHPEHQRRGIGQVLLAKVKEHALGAGATRLVLRVNRHNSIALSAYAKYGFSVYGEDVLDIGNGFVMDDYLMELKLCS
jgi:GNAT superfamily N-acetyltransferase